MIISNMTRKREKYYGKAIAPNPSLGKQITTKVKIQYSLLQYQLRELAL